MDCVRDISKDKGFQLPSEEAQTACSAVYAILQATEDNKIQNQNTAEALTIVLKDFIKVHPTSKARRKRMWVLLHKYLNSDEYFKL